MKYKRIISTLLISILGINLVLNYQQLATAGTETTKILDYELTGYTSSYEYGGILFTDKSTLQVKPITVNAPPGKVIKKLEWVDENTKTPLRSVAGFTPNVARYTISNENLNGTKYNVKSEEYANYGGVYYWDRWSVNDSAHDNGKLWKAGGGKVSVYDNTDPVKCKPRTSTEFEIKDDKGRSYQGYEIPKYPNCYDDELQSTLERKNAFNIVDEGPLEDYWIDTPGLSKSRSDVKAVNVRVDYVTDMQSGSVPTHWGTTDRTTLATDQLVVEADPNLLTVSINFTQTFNNDKYKDYWANFGAKQVHYFNKFYADIMTITYAYKDKSLMATYADGKAGLTISGNTCVAPGGTTQLTATLVKVDGSSWPLTTHPNLTWTSSSTSVATVSSSGVVSAVASSGSTDITAHFIDDTQKLDEKDSFTISVGTGSSCKDAGGPVDPDPSGSCKWVINSPSKSSTMPGGVTDPSATGVIKADSRGAEQFDVLQGIPTSESLYTNALGYNYLYKQMWDQMRGTITYNCKVDVTYVLKWQKSVPPTCGPAPAGCKPNPPLPMEETVDKTYTFTLSPRNYSYWLINSLEVYKLIHASMSNYALPGGTVTLNPAGYTAPTLSSQQDANVQNHVVPAETSAINFTPPVVTGGLDSKPSVPDDTGTLKGMAESGTQDPKVKNDTVTFNGSTIMSGAQATKDGPTPSNIPNPTMIGQDVLYKSGNVISKSLTNKANTPSTGTISYEMITGNVGGPTLPNTFPINGINTVTVHTPVVIYASISDDKAHNQKTVPAWDRSATILDRPFTVYMPTDGQHRNIPGYGDRDYAKYVRNKQVWFPFDVYTGDKSFFYPKETWISIPVNQEATTFFMPVWVDEGFYDVLFRTIAENAPDPFTNQPNANLDLTHHVASDVIPVDVVGRLYDFRITDVQDFNWETVFRTEQGASTHTGNYYWSGPNQIDGDPRGNQTPFLLPIRQGSHPEKGYRNVSVKTGYSFKFDMKTKGDMFRFDDSIRIIPTFYYVDKDGQNRQEVDLYYHSDDKRFIQIGSKDDVQKRYMVLDQRLRNVPASDITRSSSALWELFSKPLNWKMDKPTYTAAFAEHAAKEKKYIGGYPLELLISDVRTLIGQQDVPPSVNPYRVQAAEQKWYGEYSIPAAAYVVKKGTNIPDYGIKNVLDEKSDIFLKNGYVIVNFNFETIQNRDINNPHLQYINTPAMLQTDPNRNQWTLEGYRRSFTDPYGKTFNLRDGDVVFYHADQSSYDDFRSGGTH
ncbi:DUF5704 domain-containing protein [Paenibacillus sp. N1-5-1-14]|uniref:DUF5704 domain-containing protein n=1 Tax=Paenibacillus radicibacter TaxID=2972488 RepID=UPI0021596BD3|nr:DUF5704 domain-containing protein [Paenibacillus radicibacter]MCR8645156.1 DUF5704 domain-containing protein [Paenibacillus radicibacter]